MELNGQNDTPTAMSTGRKPGTHWVGDEVGPRSPLSILLVKKDIFCTRRCSNPGSSSPLLSRIPCIRSVILCKDFFSPSPVLHLSPIHLVFEFMSRCVLHIVLPSTAVYERHFWCILWRYQHPILCSVGWLMNYELEIGRKRLCLEIFRN